MARTKSAARLDHEIKQVLSAPKRATAASRAFDVHAWSTRHDQYAPEDWLYFVLDGTYSVPEMRAAIHADRAPKKSKRRPSVRFRGDVRAWSERHDQNAPEDWLYLVLDGTYSVPEMRAAILADRVPKE